MKKDLSIAMLFAFISFTAFGMEKNVVVPDFPYCVQTSASAWYMNKIGREVTKVEDKLNKLLNTTLPANFIQYTFAKKIIDEHNGFCKELSRDFKEMILSFLKDLGCKNVPEIVEWHHPEDSQRLLIQYSAPLDKIIVSSKYQQMFRKLKESQKSGYVKHMLGSVPSLLIRREKQFDLKYNYCKQSSQHLKDKQSIDIFNATMKDYEKLMVMAYDSLACIRHGLKGALLLKSHLNVMRFQSDVQSNIIFSLQNLSFEAVVVGRMNKKFDLHLRSNNSPQVNIRKDNVNQFIYALEKEKQGLLFNQFYNDPNHSLYKLTNGSKWFRRTEENKS